MNNSFFELQNWVNTILTNANLKEIEKIQCAFVAGICVTEKELRGDISEKWVSLLSDRYTRSDLIIKMKDLYL